MLIDGEGRPWIMDEYRFTTRFTVTELIHDYFSGHNYRIA